MRIITPDFIVDNVDLVQKNSPAVDELNIVCKSTNSDQIIVATFNNESELNITWNHLWGNFLSEDAFNFIGHKCDIYYNNDIVSQKDALTAEEKLLKEISDSLKSIKIRLHEMRIGGGESFVLQKTISDIADSLWYVAHKTPINKESVEENPTVQINNCDEV